jgi:hypothetical protein
MRYVALCSFKVVSASDLTIDRLITNYTTGRLNQQAICVG